MGKLASIASLEKEEKAAARASQPPAKVKRKGPNRMLLYQLAQKKMGSPKKEIPAPVAKQETFSLVVGNSLAAGTKLERLAYLPVPEPSPVGEWYPQMKAAVTFLRPMQVGTFKQIEGKGLMPSDEPPPKISLEGLVGADLNRDFDPNNDPDADKKNDDGTLELQASLKHFKFDLAEQNIDFITYRNNLNKIMATPFIKSHWAMKVHRRGRTIHLEVLVVDERVDEFHLRMKHWGRQFEALCVKRPAADKVGHIVTLKSKLNNNIILTGAEIDACRDGGSFVGIKTCKKAVTEKDKFFFKKNKLLRYWVQSYLAGVPDIAVGFRDDGGTVTGVECFETLKIPHLASQAANNGKLLWDMRVCLNFTDQVLSFLKQTVVDGQSYELKFCDPWNRLILTAMPST
ncbi:unnamed protein product [Chrysoparadoxa australica]